MFFARQKTRIAVNSLEFDSPHRLVREKSKIGGGGEMFFAQQKTRIAVNSLEFDSPHKLLREKSKMVEVGRIELPS